MPRDLWQNLFEQEIQQQEDYARDHGYFINTGREKATHYIFKQDSRSPLALCVSHDDAVRIAYALAKVFPKTEGSP